MLDPSNPHSFKATATLKQRRIAIAPNVYGWNHDYLANPPGWTRIVMADGTPRYPMSDFTNLFV